jgi:hypothetical protein
MPRRRPAAGPRAGIFGRAGGHGDLAASLVLIVPIFLIYEIGVMFSPTINGVDFVTRSVFAAVGHDRDRYLLVHLLCAVAFTVWVLASQRRRTFSADVVAPLLMESAIYALTLGAAILALMQHLLGFEGKLAIDGLGALAMTDGLSAVSLGPTGEALVVSLGAGVHEELVFRLGILSGGLALLLRSGLAPRLAIPLAVAGSALIFSLAHHLGPHGESFATSVFVYRALAGVAFGLIYWYRSLAHAVYAHVLYDVYVLVFRS